MDKVKLLTDFLVGLAVDPDHRERFHDPARREALMTEAELWPEAKEAVRSGSRLEVRHLLDNTQAASSLVPVKGPTSRTRKPKG